MIDGYERIGERFLNKLGPQSGEAGEQEDQLCSAHVSQKVDLLHPAACLSRCWWLLMHPLTSTAVRIGSSAPNILIILERNKYNNPPKSKFIRDLAVTRI